MFNISNSHNKIIVVPKNQSSFQLPNIYAISLKIPSPMSTCQLPHFRSSPLSDRGLSLVSGAGRGFCGRGAANLSSFQEWSMQLFEQSSFQNQYFCLTKFFSFLVGSTVSFFRTSTILRNRFLKNGSIIFTQKH